MAALLLCAPLSCKVLSMPEPSSTLMVGLSGRCPRCGEGALFAGYLSLKPRCTVCDLDFAFADSADGPAVFVMFIVGFIVVAAALTVEFLYEPPYWLHAVLWLPLVLGLTFGLLRPLKGLLIALQYAHKAAEIRAEAIKREDHP
jgi:uncharacterized protein (DUF983 family)